MPEVNTQFGANLTDVEFRILDGILDSHYVPKDKAQIYKVLHDIESKADSGPLSFDIALAYIKRAYDWRHCADVHRIKEDVETISLYNNSNYPFYSDVVSLANDFFIVESKQQVSQLMLTQQSIRQQTNSMQNIISNLNTLLSDIEETKVDTLDTPDAVSQVLADIADNLGTELGEIEKVKGVLDKLHKPQNSMQSKKELTFEQVFKNWSDPLYWAESPLVDLEKEANELQDKVSRVRIALAKVEKVSAVYPLGSIYSENSDTAQFFVWKYGYDFACACPTLYLITMSGKIWPEPKIIDLSYPEKTKDIPKVNVSDKKDGSMAIGAWTT